jgi:hypothetical protein
VGLVESLIGDLVRGSAGSPDSGRPTRGVRLRRRLAMGGSTAAGQVVPREVDLPLDLVYPAVRVTVAAALADGRLAPAERAAIGAHLESPGLTPDQVTQVHRDLVLPATVEELAALAGAEPARRTLYGLAALVLHSDREVTGPERAWLARLGDAFGLGEGDRRWLEGGLLGDPP